MIRHDAVATACAILGLPQTCSDREVKHAYKRLVKIWHPDRFANDPVGQAAATERLRQINAAYDLLQQRRGAATDLRNVNAAPVQRPSQRPEQFGHRLTREEIDEISSAIGRGGFVQSVQSFLAWFGPVCAGVLLLQGHGTGPFARKPPSRTEVGFAILLFAFSLAVVVRRRRRQ